MKGVKGSKGSEGERRGVKGVKGSEGSEGEQREQRGAKGAKAFLYLVLGSPPSVAEKTLMITYSAYVSSPPGSTMPTQSPFT